MGDEDVKRAPGPPNPPPRGVSHSEWKRLYGTPPQASSVQPSGRWCQGCGKPESELTNVGQGGHLVPPDVACGPLSTPEELIEALDDTRSQLADALAVAVEPDGERLWKAIEDANEALLDIGFGGDVEHQIDSHADGVPDVLRRYAAAAQKAVDALQVPIHARLDAAEERARKAKP